MAEFTHEQKTQLIFIGAMVDVEDEAYSVINISYKERPLTN